jgi:hypothetical protein
MTKRIVGCFLGASLIFSATAFGQSDPNAKVKDKTRWGVTSGFSPDWKVDEGDKLGSLFFKPGADSDSGNVNITGYEFRIGMARGRELGGDWAVTFVRRRIDDGSTVGKVEQTCQEFTVPPFPPGTKKTLCGVEGTKGTYHDASMMGIEVNKFFAFATIKKRVQIGMNLGIGVTMLHGTADVVEYTPFIFQPNGNVIVNPNPPGAPSTIPAADTFSMKNAAIGKVQFSVAGILPGSIKIRLDTGYAFPGMMLFSLTGTYFFGHR